MAAPPVTTKKKPRVSPLLRGPRQITLLIGVVVAIISGLIAVVLPYWWFELPAISAFGLLSWKRNYFLGVLVSFVFGVLLWIVQMELLPSAPLGRIVTAVAGVEGVSGGLLFVLGALLLGVVSALGSATVAGIPRMLAAIRRAPGPSVEPAAND